MTLDGARIYWKLRKWRVLFSICMQESFAYRASMFIWVLGDVLPAIAMPLVWAQAAGKGSIAGFKSGDFVLYYLCMLPISSFITSHMMWEFANEIRDGQFSTFLLRPISYFEYNIFRNFSWRFIRLGLFMPIFFGIVMLYRGFLGEVHVTLTPAFWVSLMLGHVLSFAFSMMLGTLAFYTQEAMSVFELYYIPMLFLSGQLFPVDLFPAWARSLADWMPFYYTTGVPTEILVGRQPLAHAPQLIAIQAAWILACLVIFALLWKRGLKEYSGVGM